MTLIDDSLLKPSATSVSEIHQNCLYRPIHHHGQGYTYHSPAKLDSKEPGKEYSTYHFTSPAALRPFGRALCTEQRKAKAKLWMKIITRASILVSLERAKQEIIRGETTRRNTFQRIENTRDILKRYFE